MMIHTDALPVRDHLKKRKTSGSRPGHLGTVRRRGSLAVARNRAAGATTAGEQQSRASQLLFHHMHAVRRGARPAPGQGHPFSASSVRRGGWLRTGTPGHASLAVPAHTAYGVLRHTERVRRVRTQMQRKGSRGCASAAARGEMPSAATGQYVQGGNPHVHPHWPWPVSSC